MSDELQVKRSSSADAEPRPPRGYSWPPFEEGHTHSLTHGAYSSLARLGERVAELTDTLEMLVPGYRPSDGPAVQLLALTLARIERGEKAVAAAEDAGDVESVARLRSDLRGWVNASVRLLDALAMTPGSRARLGLDVAMTRRALTATELHAAAALEGEATEETAP